MRSQTIAKLAFGFLFFSFLKQTRAQLKDVYHPGTVQLTNGTKQNGYLKEDELSSLSHKLFFKQNPDSKKPTEYDTTQLSGFEFASGGRYRQLQIGIDDSAAVAVTVFAKLLVEGKASLYQSSYDNEDLFVIEKDGRLTVLQNDKIIPGSTSGTVKSYYYKTALTNATGGFLPTDESLEKLEFSAKTFVHIISSYDNAVGSAPRLYFTKNKLTNFLIASLTGMTKGSNENEISGQIGLRAYVPAISQSTAINVGIAYFRDKYSVTTGNNIYEVTHHYSSDIISLPVSVQQNLLNKNIRPYVFGGVAFSLAKLEVLEGASKKSEFGASPLYGGGLEIDIVKGLMIKGEYRNDVISHLVMAGIGYHLPLGK